MYISKEHEKKCVILVDQESKVCCKGKAVVLTGKLLKCLVCKEGLAFLRSAEIHFNFKSYNASPHPHPLQKTTQTTGEDKYLSQERSWAQQQSFSSADAFITVATQNTLISACVVPLTLSIFHFTLFIIFHQLFLHLFVHFEWDFRILLITTKTYMGQASIFKIFRWHTSGCSKV